MPSLQHVYDEDGNGNGKAGILGGHATAQSRLRQPLSYSGSLEKLTHQKLYAIFFVVSQRGVVFLRDQTVTPTQMKDLMLRITELSGCPKSSGLHVHPLTEEGSELGDQISVISSEKQKKGGGLTHQLSDVSRFASAGWHTDISFEPVPSDYAMLKIHTLPPTGGDTLWASGYEIYDRLSPAMQIFLEGLTATHDANFGEGLTAIHPVIRTNPVTGWKSVYVNKGFTKRINGITKDESDLILNYLINLVTQNHDVMWHCATYDYNDSRAGDRVCSLGEAPYLGLKSKSRKEAVGQM
ncbi:hypothetical protein GQ44DRAFT_753498 [Phaeosphaeriaceae sp. PMI808]|nr:hypothetical protein GQ44DRAFT_753498 [Phaeosphaeriaceae sp. PMI808]